MSPTFDTDVVIVGAGPVGLVIALNIARAGIKVTVLEQHPEVIQSPRAMAYGPAAVVELERAGIAADCRATGMDESDFHASLRWIQVDGTEVARIDRLVSKYPPVLCGQHKVAEIILRHMEKYPHAKVLWNHNVQAIEQDEESVTAVCQTPEGTKKITGKYLVGSDGARSTVRKLIGCTFDGFTYDKMVVATNVYYPFKEHGWTQAQFLIHPEHFALVRSSSLRLIVDWQMCSRWTVPLFLRRRCILVLRRSPRQTRL